MGAARLGHAEMQGIVGPFGKNPVCRNHHRHRRSLDRKNRIIKVHFFQQTGMVKGAFGKRLRHRCAVTGENMFFKRTGIDADTNGNPCRAAGAHHGKNMIAFPDIAGVNADFIRPCRHGGEGNTIVKMNIRHQRNTYPCLFQIGEGCRCGNIRHGKADNIRPSPLQCLHSAKGRGAVGGVSIGHRLHGDRRVAADDPCADAHTP